MGLARLFVVVAAPGCARPYDLAPEHAKLLHAETATFALASEVASTGMRRPAPRARREQRVYGNTRRPYSFETISFSVNL